MTDLAAAYELRVAERDAALSALDKLERMIKRIGGHMTPEDQATLRAATAVLAEQGHRRTLPVFPARTPTWAVDGKRRT